MIVNNTAYNLPYQIFSLAGDWFKSFTCLNMPHLKLGNIRVMILRFENELRKIFERNSHKGLHLARKCIRIVLGHYGPIDYLNEV